MNHHPAVLAVFVWLALITACTSGVFGGGDAPSVNGGDSEGDADSSSNSDAADDQGSDSDSNAKADDDQPPIVVGDCGSLAAVGTWEDITPQDVRDGDGGTFSFAVDPVNSGTIYLGTVYLKMWKSTDCGSTWTKLDSGRNANAWDHAMNWTFAIDPLHPDTVYTNSGYGTQNSYLYRSLNGGIDWDVLWPSATQSDIAAHFTYQFVNVITLDPADPTHMVVTFHESCDPDVDDVSHTCFIESKDGGETWILHRGQAGWNGNEGQLFYFLDASDHWIWASQSDGFYRTDDAGETWTQVVDEKGQTIAASHIQGAALYRAKDKSFYVAASSGIYHSPDGISWTAIANTNPIGGGLTSDGTTMFYSRCMYQGFCQADDIVFLSSPETDGLTWTPIEASPRTSMGGELHYDAGHNVLFASTFAGGFWRVVTK